MRALIYAIVTLIACLGSFLLGQRMSVTPNNAYEGEAARRMTTASTEKAQVDIKKIEAALQAQMGLPPGPRRRDALVQYLYELAKSEPIQAMAIANKLSFSERKAAYVAVLKGWMEKDVEGAWKWYRQNEANTAFTTAVVGDITRAFASRDFAWAVNHMGELIGDQKVPGWRGIFESADSVEKLRSLTGMVDKLGNTYNDRSIRNFFYKSWGESFPQEALAYFNSKTFTSKSERLQAFEFLVRGMVANEPTAAITASSGFPADLSQSGFDYIIERWSADGNKEAIALWLSNNQDISAFSGSQIASICGNIADQNPRLALQLAQRLDSETDRNNVLEKAIRSLTLENKADALQWISSIAKPEQATNLYVKVALAESNGMSTPELAIKTVEAFPTETARDAASFALAMQWRTVDLPAAIAYYQKTTSISESRRQQILQFLGAK